MPVSTRAAARRAQTVTGGWSILPHGLGNQVSPPKETPSQDLLTDAAKGANNEAAEECKSRNIVVNKNTGGHQARDDAVTRDKIPGEDKGLQPKKRMRSSTTGKQVEKTKRARKSRHPYGLTPGLSPFPDYSKPTPEEAREVFDILAQFHQFESTRHPDQIPEPSLEKAGCGEVPSVLDALLRTVLSASTTFDHANNMLKALVKKYGALEGGIGTGSVNWQKVHLASPDEVSNAIKVGGLNKSKAKYIKGILHAVCERNLKKLTNLSTSRNSSASTTVTSAKAFVSEDSISNERPTSIPAPDTPIGPQPGMTTGPNGVSNSQVHNDEGSTVAEGSSNSEMNEGSHNAGIQSSTSTTSTLFSSTSPGQNPNGGIIATVASSPDTSPSSAMQTKAPTLNELLSLNYMFGMSHEEAMSHLLTFPGVGVKTASCVILFCLQLPSFAVDTHVFRFCQWLRWVPLGCKSRDKVFMHCQVRIPDELKYGLHQLFIRHGQTCHRCGASTAPGTKEWYATICPLEHLVDRTIATKAVNKKRAAEKAADADADKEKEVEGRGQDGEDEEEVE